MERRMGAPRLGEVFGVAEALHPVVEAEAWAEGLFGAGWLLGGAFFLDG
jgi:hypothetical protein